MTFSFFLSYLGTGGFFSLVLTAFYFYCLFFLGDSPSLSFFVQIALLRGYLISSVFAFVTLWEARFLADASSGGCVFTTFVSLSIFTWLPFPPLFLFLRTKTRSMGVAKHRSRLWALWGFSVFTF